MELGKRLECFIKNCYETKTNFAAQTKLANSAISRYLIDGSTPTADMLLKFNEAGLCIDWLLTGYGSMFAHNEKGKSFRDQDDAITNKLDTPYNRIKSWINDNYGSIQMFAVTYDLDYNEIINMLNKDLLPDMDIISFISTAGCSLDWMSSGDGSPYEENPVGLILKMRKESKLKIVINKLNLKELVTNDKPFSLKKTIKDEDNDTIIKNIKENENENE